MLSAVVLWSVLSVVLASEYYGPSAAWGGYGYGRYAPGYGYGHDYAPAIYGA